MARKNHNPRPQVANWKTSYRGYGPAAISRLSEAVAELPEEPNEPFHPFQMYRRVTCLDDPKFKLGSTIAKFDEQIWKVAGRRGLQYDPIAPHELIVPILPTKLLREVLRNGTPAAREAGRLALESTVASFDEERIAWMLRGLSVGATNNTTAVSLLLKSTKFSEDRQRVCETLGSEGFICVPPDQITMCIGTLPFRLGQRETLQAELIETLAPQLKIHKRDPVILGPAVLTNA